MKLPCVPAAVVFDLDGLIFDTEALYQQAILAAAVETGHAVTQELFLGMVGRSWQLNRSFLQDHLGQAFPVEAFRIAWMDQFEKLMATDLRLKVGVVELLDTLDDLHLPRAIATSSSHPYVRRLLSLHGLDERFDVIVAHGDYIRGKPDPDPFLQAATRLGVAPQLCLALEDSHSGVRSAAAAGMMTIMVPDLLPPSEELQALCVCVTRDLMEVGRIVRAALCR